MAGKSLIDLYLDREIARARVRARQMRQRETGASQSVSQSVSSSVTETVIHVLVAIFVGRLRALLVSLVLAVVPLAVFGLQVLLTALSGTVRADAGVWVSRIGVALPIAALLAMLTVLLTTAVQWQRQRRGQAGMMNRIDVGDDTGYVLRLVGSLTASMALAALTSELAGVHFSSVARGAIVLAPIVLVLITILVLMARALFSGFGAALEPLQAASAVGAVAPDNGEVRALDERIDRLTQIREWLKDDALRKLVDEAIGKQVGASERRQAIYSIVIGVVSLVAGWLLSSVNAFNLIGHL